MEYEESDMRGAALRYPIPRRTHRCALGNHTTCGKTDRSEAVQRLEWLCA